jgi:ATP-binding cassette subfamily B protein
MARLYDPVTGVVLLGGRDIRSFVSSERTKKIGFILQDPFLFNGTVMENIVYGNVEYGALSADDLSAELKRMGLSELLDRFDGGLSGKVAAVNGMSLGQKQIIAFMRAVLRKPEILILDEATANIDTVTEQVLQSIIQKLPPETTKVVIAHRLNTIQNADEIFFVNTGEVTRAGSMERAVELLMRGNRKS